jgi:hypothetical protein
VAVRFALDRRFQCSNGRLAPTPDSSYAAKTSPWSPIRPRRFGFCLRLGLVEAEVLGLTTRDDAWFVGAAVSDG